MIYIIVNIFFSHVSIYIILKHFDNQYVTQLLLHIIRISHKINENT